MQAGRAQKEKVVSSIRTGISGSNTVILAHYQGLTVEEINKIRRDIKGIGGNFRVTKNSLARLAIEDTGFSQLSSLLTGPTAMAYANDPIAAAKAMVGYAEENKKLIILGGVVENQVITSDGVKTLATIPSLDELRARIIGALMAPATRLASIVQAPAGQLARVVNAYSSKNSN